MTRILGRHYDLVSRRHYDLVSWDAIMTSYPVYDLVSWTPL